jgi:putative FmdB family regulatory protein
MPIYEYQCLKCHIRFEALRPINDDGRDLACPECGGGEPEKVFSTFATSSVVSGGCGGGGGGG